MQTYRLKRHGKVDLEFEGELIADASSEEPEKERWQRFRLFRVPRGNRADYVLERLGESRVPGDVTMRSVNTLPNPNQVRRALERTRPGGEKYLTVVALDLLDQAAANDELFRETVVERL